MQNIEIEAQEESKTQAPNKDMGLNLFIDRSAGRFGDQKKKKDHYLVDLGTPTVTYANSEGKRPGKARDQYLPVNRTQVVSQLGSHGAFPGKAYHTECTIKWTGLGEVPQRHEVLGLHLHLDDLGSYLDYPYGEGENPLDQPLVTTISQLVRLD